MKKRIFLITMVLILTILVSSCSVDDSFKKAEENVVEKSNKDIIFENDNTNKRRNELIIEDIEYVRTELPKNHIDPFSIISEKEFNEKLSNLCDNVDKLDRSEIYIELGKIISSIGDAHTRMSYWDGKKYPLQFYMFNDEIYITNADRSLEDIMYSKIISIDNVSYEDIISELTQQIPYENESWLKYRLPSCIYPFYLYGLGIAKNGDKSIFEVEKDGEIKKIEVSILSREDEVDFCSDKTNNKITGKYEKNYDYKYLENEKAVYFEYNVCNDMTEGTFENFSLGMFQDIKFKEVEKIIIDLRANTGGNSEILNPFTEELKKYRKVKDKVKVYVLVGRQTFSSGVFAIFSIKEVAEDAIFIGEASGGAIEFYANIKELILPNSQFPMWCSIQYYNFSDVYDYKQNGINAFLPDIILSPSIDDYINNRDVVLERALND